MEAPSRRGMTTMTSGYFIPKEQVNGWFLLIYLSIMLWNDSGMQILSRVRRGIKGSNAWAIKILHRSPWV